jgi:hypothetical protein
VTYKYVTVSNERDKVLKGDTPIAWITREEKTPPDGATGGFAPAMHVYAVYRYSERARDKRGARVGEKFTHHGAFDLAVNRCG